MKFVLMCSFSGADIGRDGLFGRGAPRMTISKARISLRLLSVLILVGLTAATVALALVTRSLVADQQSRLLHERTNEAGALVTTLFGSIQTTLPILAESTHLQPGSTAQFVVTARQFVGPEASTIGALQVGDGGVTAVAAVGNGPVAGLNITGSQAALAQRAVTAKGSVSAVIDTPHGKRLEFATPVAGLVVYEDVAIDPSKTYRAGPNDPFAELDGAIYASPSTDSSALVLATTRHLPLTGRLDRLPITVGVQKWLLVTDSRRPLVGSLAANAPWAVLFAGLLGALLTTMLVETLLRRRSYALALVDERTVALQEATRAAQAANQSKSEFLSRMSHELRTPLNAVLGFAQLLELDELTDLQHDSVGQIVKGGRHLLNLINEVLDISRIDTGTLSFSLEPVLVGELIDETLVMMRPLADHRQIAVTVGCEDRGHSYVLADRQRLKQILLNLVANAIKYNHDGGAVSVSCESVEDERLRITVADTGPGIKTEDLDKLFIAFERLGAERGDIEGTGVGLTLSLRLAEAMGGTIDVDSTYGQGSRFSVQLPLADDPLQTHREAEELTPDSDASPDDVREQRRKILYIEDNPSNVRLVERLLDRRSDLEIISTMQGRMGVNLAREHAPALILLDLHLPDINGDEILRQLQDDPVTAATPIVIVSADATQRQIERLLAQGATGYLTKPLDLQELLATIERALDQTPTTAV